MDWPGTGPEGPDKAARTHAGSGSSSSRSDLHRRWSVGRYKNGGRPGSVLAQKLVGAPLPLIKCDDCPKKVMRHVSTTPEHPGWVFIKCLNDGNGCKFWYWEEEYIDILIERNLVDVRALLASIEARDETTALVARIEAKHETKCEEATSASLHSKKKKARIIEPPQINNECIEKALIQLTGAVMKVGYLLKCILVVLVFFGLTFLVKIW
nr:uncharacterized protein LOC120966040 [Aegilops tauschii subsp. strangulata]